MEYFFSHIGYILIAALFAAALGIGMIIAAEKSREITEEKGYDPELDKSDLACAGCRFFQLCSGQAALKPKDEVGFVCEKENGGKDTETE